MKLNNHNFEVVLYRQSITRNGSLERMQTLTPYDEDSDTYFENLKGADWDIDKAR